MRGAGARLRRAEDLGVETCGRIAQFWGFTRTMGRSFGLLYLAPAPLARADIERRLGISVGNASMTLAALAHWGVVHRVRLPGERRDRYRAETDFWKMISGVLNERERREIKSAVGVMRRARKDAVSAQRGLGREERAGAACVAERLAHLLRVCELGETMLDLVLGDLRLDLGHFRNALRGAP